MTVAAAVRAFDRAAADYDQGFGRNAVGLLQRHVFQARLLQRVRAGQRVLDLGCGTGEDALVLAALGVEVAGVDPAPGMVERARARAEAAGLGARASFTCMRAEDVGALGGGFDAAFSDFGGLNLADLPQVGRALEQALRPGAPLLISLLGPSPLPLLVRRALRAEGTRRGEEQPRVAGVAVPVSYPSPAQAQRLLGPAFAWTGGFALGVLLPPPSHAAWAEAHPQAFGLLAAAEKLVRGCPGLRALGDHVVLEGRRR